MFGSTATVSTAAQTTMDTGLVAMSDLEAKRQAVLASMRKRRATSRSRSASESPLVPVDTVKRISLPTLEDAIIDLRSLGYTFDMILERSGISREFLEKCYRRWDFPIPIKPVEQTSPVPTQRPTHIHHHHQNNSSSSSSSHTYQKPLFANKVYRPDGGRPEWLKSLVIDLNSSDEESEDERMEESDSSETTSAPIEVSEVKEETIQASRDSPVPQVIDTTITTHQRSNSSTSTSIILGQTDVFDDCNDDYDPEDIPQKKRKLSKDLRFGNLTLDDLLSKKKILEQKMKDLSEQVSFNDDRWNQIEASILLSTNALKEKELRVTTYRNMIYSLESEIQQENDTISSLMHEKTSLPDSRAEMAKCLVEMEALENEEEKLKETERRRVDLRGKLLKQMKEKKKKKEQQKQQLDKVELQHQHSDEEEDYQQDQVSPTSPQLTTKQETPTNNTPDKQVFDETIHKIPKAQVSHFTPYKSLGLTQKATIHNDDNDMALCPLELVNGTCTDKHCQFKHLSDHP